MKPVEDNVKTPLADKIQFFNDIKKIVNGQPDLPLTAKTQTEKQKSIKLDP
jgi:hypothetical protein